MAVQTEVSPVGVADRRWRGVGIGRADGAADRSALVGRAAELQCLDELLAAAASVAVGYWSCAAKRGSASPSSSTSRRLVQKVSG